MAHEGESRAAITKERYRERVPELRELLLEAQFDLRERSDSAFLLILGGPGAASKAALGHRLCKWMDMRFIETRTFDAPGAAESGMPWLRRYWGALPSKGSTGLFYGSWYNDVLNDYIAGRTAQLELEAGLMQVRILERLLSLEGIRILKVWLDSNGEAEADAGGAGEAHCRTWVRSRRTGRPSPTASAHHEHRPRAVGDRRRRRCPLARPDRRRDGSRGARPGDRRHRPEEPPSVSAAIDAASLPAAEPEAVPPEPLENSAYQEKLEKQQKRLAKVAGSKPFAKRSLLVVMEGVDAAGKGGAIRRITEALDPRLFQVHGYAAPSDYEASYPYLWRFWKNLPRPGRIAIYDRSHYGRVLVERVEGLCSPAAWGRAFGEINEFEQELIDAGIIVQKFWLTISKEEQLRRFEDRENTPWKRHKITEEDWRNREKWDAYQEAKRDMLERTNLANAPWHVVSSEDKRSARVEVLKILNREIRKAMNGD